MKVYATYEQIKKDYPYTKENPNKAYDVFTDYVMDKISFEERREVRKNWNGNGDWHDYLLKEVNLKTSKAL
ncbi:MAG: hypothetical protein CMH22_06000 [Methylophaga sp.]|nr:hypothetical protein [Methylophaga sp.]|tara:strand:+ start:62680 stop:62892 length:213 start_codon:yes stop_codon:yes gene_type:complete